MCGNLGVVLPVPGGAAGVEGGRRAVRDAGVGDDAGALACGGRERTAR